jgi:hypothetical protein
MVYCTLDDGNIYSTTSLSKHFITSHSICRRLEYISFVSYFQVMILHYVHLPRGGVLKIYINIRLYIYTYMGI